MSGSFYDAVNHPAHYTRGGIESADIVDAYELCWYLGNALKYLLRAGKKDKTRFIEDLEKAAWMIQRKIALLRKAGA